MVFLTTWCLTIGFCIIGVAAIVGVGVGVASSAYAASGAKAIAVLRPMASSFFSIVILRCESAINQSDSPPQWRNEPELPMNGRVAGQCAACPPERANRRRGLLLAGLTPTHRLRMKRRGLAA